MRFLKYALLLGFMAVSASSVLHAQCHGGGSGHDGHGGSGGHSGHGDSEPARVTPANTICPVLGNPVKQGKDLEVVLGGRLYIVCCRECRVELAENREKYLDQDGRPKNDAKKPEERQPADPPSEHKH